MTKFLLALTILLTFNSFSYASGKAEFAKTFKSDSCTKSPNGYWGHCCVEHDYLYWKGGSFAERKFADELLRQCMKDAKGPGKTYYKFVRAQGTNYWSSAWVDQNRNTQVTEEEEQIIQAEHDLWISIGRSVHFDFINTESILFPQLTEEQLNLVEKETTKIRQTPEYQEFREQYIQRRGIEPIF